MNKKNKYFLGIYYRLADLLTLNVAFFVAAFLRFNDEKTYGSIENEYLILLIFINFSWIILSNSQKLYNLFTFNSKRRYFFRVGLVVVFQLLLIIGFNGLLKTFYSRLFLFYTFASFGVLMLFFRGIISLIYKAYLHKNFQKNIVIIIGTNFSMNDVKSFLKENSMDSDSQKVEVISNIDNIFEHIDLIKSKNPISEIYIGLSKLNSELVNQITSYCDNNFIRLRLVMDWQKIGSKQIEARKLSHTTVLNIPLTPLDDYYNTLLKRGFDILFSSIIILSIFSWLFPILALIIKLTSKGPVFFIQKRTGLDNKDFYCLKFRSMSINKDADTQQAVKKDKRITKIGSFIRKTSLDEFPQFFNVLKGEMSVVGPRPHMLKHTEEYSKLTDNFMNRHAIKPGITGLAQIKGYRGEIDNYSLLVNRIRLDRFYVNNWSVYLDLKIVFFTIFTTFQNHR